MILVGPSGCGKSTLILRMIAGLVNISSGEIAIGERVVNNVTFALSLVKVPRDVIDQQVARAAQIFGLPPYLNRYPHQLSGGPCQRVAMGWCCRCRNR